MVQACDRAVEGWWLVGRRGKFYGIFALVVPLGFSFFLLCVSIVLDRGTCLTYFACNIIATRAARSSFII